MTTLQRWKQEARRAEQRSDWRRAIDLYREAARVDESTEEHSDLSLWNRIGDLHVRLGEIPEAVNCYERAADRYAEHDLPTSAIALCNKILRLAPDRDLVYRRLARLHAASGLRAEGRAACLRFVTGRVAAGDLAEARAAVEEFLDLTGDAGLRLEFAEVLERAGARDEAREQLRIASGDGDAGGRVTEAAERHLARLTDGHDASVPPPPEVTSAPVSAAPDESAVPASLPRDETAAQRCASSEPAARQLTSDEPAAGEPDPPRPRLDALLRAAFAESGRESPLAGPVGPVDAAGASEDASTADPTIRNLLAALAPVLEREGPEASYDLGVALQALGYREEAAELLRDGMGAPGRWRAAALRITACLPPSGEGTAEREPEPRPRMAGDAEADAAPIGDPEPDVAPAGDAEPEVAPAGDPEARYELAVAFRQMGMWEEALTELEAAVAALPDPFPAWEEIGQCLAGLGREEEAVATLRRVVDRPPADGPERLGVLYRLADLLERAARTEEATRTWERILAVDPGFRDAAHRLAALSGPR
ncbi:MAG: tetratricopeptide repeat protein [Gemmatimonadota bacterium]|nr:tetratricopeptide repeat protein [Gemmatimonadota bacterium]